MSVLWYVKLSDGDVAPLTLEGIDEAFQAGSIDRDTMVLAPGSTKWARLAELAGLDEPAQRPQTTEPSPLPGSLRPFSVYSLGADDATGSDLKPASGKAKWLFAAALVASVFGAAAFEARRADAVSVGRVLKTFGLVTIGHPASPSAAAASLPASPSPATAAPPSPENAPVQTAAGTAPGAASPMVVAQSAAVSYNALTDLSNRVRPDQVAASQKREHFAKAHAKVHAASGMQVSGSKSKSQGFTTGGNKFDPLNATIP